MQQWLVIYFLVQERNLAFPNFPFLFTTSMLILMQLHILLILLYCSGAQYLDKKQVIEAIYEHCINLKIISNFKHILGLQIIEIKTMH
jgi:hypothetical protein